MERYNLRHIDELSRVVVHSDIRKKLRLETGDEVSLTPIGTIVVLQRAEGEPGAGCYVSKVSELGAIEIPTELKQKMEWKTADGLATYLTDNLVIYKLAS